MLRYVKTTIFLQSMVGWSWNGSARSYSGSHRGLQERFQPPENKSWCRGIPWRRWKTICIGSCDKGMKWFLLASSLNMTSNLLRYPLVCVEGVVLYKSTLLGISSNLLLHFLHFCFLHIAKYCYRLFWIITHVVIHLVSLCYREDRQMLKLKVVSRAKKQLSWFIKKLYFDFLNPEITSYVR